MNLEPVKQQVKWIKREADLTLQSLIICLSTTRHTEKIVFRHQPTYNGEGGWRFLLVDKTGSPSHNQKFGTGSYYS